MGSAEAEASQRVRECGNHTDEVEDAEQEGEKLEGRRFIDADRRLKATPVHDRSYLFKAYRPLSKVLPTCNACGTCGSPWSELISAFSAYRRKI